MALHILPMACKTIFGTFFNSRNIHQLHRRRSMARNAIVHRPRICLLDHIHLLDIAVAGLARDILIHVDAVVEVRVIRHFVNPFPQHQLSLIIILCQSDDVRSVLPRNGMTVHTRIHRRDHRMTRLRSAGMAILAIDSHRSRMQFMRIRDRLFGLIINAVAFSTRNIIGKC